MKVVLCILSVSIVQCLSEKLQRYSSFVHLDIRTHSVHLFCGGTYIQEYWVITSAHCLDDTLLQAPRTGKHDRVKLLMDGNKVNAEEEQVRQSKTLILHPGYVNNHEHRRPFVKTKQKEFDIGLIEIDAPFVINDNVKIATIGKTMSSRPRLLAVGYTMQPSELIGCSKQGNAPILKCKEELEARYSGGPLYDYDSKEVIAILVNAYNEEYGLILSKYLIWIKTAIYLQSNGTIERAMEVPSSAFSASVSVINLMFISSVVIISNM